MIDVLGEMRRRKEELRDSMVAAPPKSMEELQNRVGQHKALQDMLDWVEEERRKTHGQG